MVVVTGTRFAIHRARRNVDLSFVCIGGAAHAGAFDVLLCRTAGATSKANSAVFVVRCGGIGDIARGHVGGSSERETRCVPSGVFDWSASRRGHHWPLHSCHL